MDEEVGSSLATATLGVFRDLERVGPLIGDVPAGNDALPALRGVKSGVGG